MSGHPKFEVVYDARARRLRWTMRELWQMTDVAAFAAALRDAVAPLGPPPHSYDCIADSRTFPVQTAEVSAALGEIERVGAGMRTGRMAVVVGSMINKLQVQRTLVAGEVKVFLSLHEAQAWLSEPRGADDPSTR